MKNLFRKMIKLVSKKKKPVNLRDQIDIQFRNQFHNKM